jgi:hypothetical protein
MYDIGHVIGLPDTLVRDWTLHALAREGNVDRFIQREKCPALPEAVRPRARRQPAAIPAQVAFNNKTKQPSVASSKER